MGPRKGDSRTRGLFGRLLFIFAGLGVAIAGSFFMSFHFLNASPVHETINYNLENYANYLIKDIGLPPDPAKTQQIAKAFNLVIGVYGPDQVIKSSPRLPDIDKIQRIKNRISNLKSFKRHYFFISKQDGYTYVFGFKRDKAEKTLWPLGLAFGLSLIFVMMAYHLIQKMFKPLNNIQEAAQKIASGDFSHSIPVEGHGLLTELSLSINDMGEKISSMFEAKQDLLLAIAHELRTPLTRAKLHLEFLEDSKTKSKLTEEIDEISKLITDILDNERLKDGHSALELQSTPLKAMCEKIINEHFADQKQQIELKVHQEAVLSIDPIKYSIAIKNLLENALRYGRGKTIVLELGSDHLSVIDYGKGISPSDLPKLTQAFYRVDKGRERSSGGVGLGLYLVSQIVKAHGHQLKIESGDKTVFRISFHRE